MFAVGFGQFRIDVAIIKCKGKAGAEAPSTVELVHYPKDLNGEIASVCVFEVID